MSEEGVKETFLPELLVRNSGFVSLRSESLQIFGRLTSGSENRGKSRYFDPPVCSVQPRF
jgi:hypothetical protein